MIRKIIFFDVLGINEVNITTYVQYTPQGITNSLLVFIHKSYARNLTNSYTLTYENDSM